MVANCTGNQHRVARPGQRTADLPAGRNPADTGGIDEHPIRFSSFDDFGVAGHDRHAGFQRGGLHAGNNAFQHFHRQSFFDDESCGEIQRLCAGHAHIVHRAAHSQAANIAAGEKQRADDVRIGGNCQTAVELGFERQQEGRKVVRLGQDGVGKSRGEYPLDQFLRHAAAAAVSHHDLVIVAHGHRAGGTF